LVEGIETAVARIVSKSGSEWWGCRAVGQPVLTRKARRQIQQPIRVESELLLSPQEHVGALTDEVGQEECQLLLRDLREQCQERRCEERSTK